MKVIIDHDHRSHDVVKDQGDDNPVMHCGETRDTSIAGALTENRRRIGGRHVLV